MCMGGRLHGRCCRPPPHDWRPILKPYRPIIDKKPFVPPTPPPPAEEQWEIPLTGAAAHVRVEDFVAEVTLKQRYENKETQAIEAVYEFPLQEGAAVADFWAEVDGKRIQGEIKEKEEAKDVYDDAIASGHGAYLLEQDEKRPNLFSASVGNLPAGKEVLIVVRYVIELGFTDENQLRLVLSALPYSPTKNQTFEAPSRKGDEGTFNSTVAHGLNVSVDFRMSSGIKKVSSPTHPIEFEFGDSTSDANVQLANQDNKTQPITKDFHIDVVLRDPHKPVAKLEATADRRSKEAREAAMVSFYPDLNEDEADEIYNEMIFLVDQSGSMSRNVGGGVTKSRIQAVKESLNIFLKGLPEGTMFNIIGFGTRHKPLFKDSREYDEASLDEAVKHVNGLRSNMGGTNILRPLQEIFKTPPKDGVPRILFVLTDGEVSNTQACVDEVRQNSDTTRVFTLGVSSEASAALVAGMAKAGEGKSYIVGGSDNLDARVMQCLNAAAKPALTNIRVNWGDALKGKVQQSPAKLPPLFAGSRMCVYGFLDKSLFAEGGPLADGADPVTVEITADTGAGDFKATAELSAKSRLLPPPAEGEREGAGGAAVAAAKADGDQPDAPTRRLVAALAARSMIRDMEEGRSHLHYDEAGEAVKPAPKADLIKDAIIDLSIATNVLSKHTAFVAVEERDEAADGEMKLREMKFQDTSLQKKPRPGAAPSLQPAPAPQLQSWRGGPTGASSGARERSMPRSGAVRGRGGARSDVAGPPAGAVRSRRHSPPGALSRLSSSSSSSARAGPPPPPSAAASAGPPPPQMQQQQQFFGGGGARGGGGGGLDDLLSAPKARKAGKGKGLSMKKKESSAPRRSSNRGADAFYMEAEKAAAPAFDAEEAVAPLAADAFMASADAAGASLSVSSDDEDDDDFAAAKEEEEEAEPEPAQTDDNMRKVIAAQAHSGAFPVSALQLVLASATEDSLKKALPDGVADKLGAQAALLAATAALIAVFETRWAGSKDTWMLIVKKANVFLRRESKKADVDADWSAIGRAIASA